MAEGRLTKQGLICCPDCEMLMNPERTMRKARLTAGVKCTNCNAVYEHKKADDERVVGPLHWRKMTAIEALKEAVHGRDGG